MRWNEIVMRLRRAGEAPDGARRWLAGCCVLLLAAVLAPTSLLAQGDADGSDRVAGSGYLELPGESFFLLADRSYGSDEIAQVRLEAPRRDFGAGAMEEYGGVDIRLYRIDKPLEFLQGQRNLHRIRIDPGERGSGLANTLSFLWDHAWRQSRSVMQRAFAGAARVEVTAQVPQLKTGEPARAARTVAPVPQYGLIAGLPLVSQFRYPLWDAKAIEAPADVELAGSTHLEFGNREGNVHVPLGKLAPGLYLAEAIVREHRATTVVFVSDTVAVSKIAGKELLVWTSRRSDGGASAQARILWSDGLGVMRSGQTDDSGLLRMAHASPHRSYLLGEDAQGGVFVVENFYYDSEVYQHKLFAFTDRPLYRAGETVQVKVLGRRFTGAIESEPAQSAPLDMVMIDANGAPVQSQTLAFDAIAGGQASFTLPDTAVAGGYELRFDHLGQRYTSAFRVAEFSKPHFEIALHLAKPEFHTDEPVEAEVVLLYPDGKPVADARIDVSLRAQQLSVIDNELQYLGQFPIELESGQLTSDARGRARLSLPAAEQPSRYLLTLFASDGAAYRVRTSREILIERGAARYRLETARRFSLQDEAVAFEIVPERRPATPAATDLLENDRQAQQAALTAPDTAAADLEAPLQLRWIRLEDRAEGTLTVPAPAQGKRSVSLRLPAPGNYSLHLLDTRGMIVGGGSHTVGGKGIATARGTIAIVMDAAGYQPGDTATALITFPEPVRDALLTLERDRVEHTALLSAAMRGDAGWLAVERLSDTQYRARIDVLPEFAPNMTFSALYARDGEYGFQNAGIRVQIPAIDVAIHTVDTPVRPGDEVEVEISTTRDGKPVSAQVVASVVDEMIYVLQPEVAPTMEQFFYHPRRSNVRTTTSLSFISYDLALPGRGRPPENANRSERAVKLLERPRREEVDTAAWEPMLRTGADGKVTFAFRMPDSLTRWRITARAIDDEGKVGQRRQHVLSHRPYYLKWSGPDHFRAGDQPDLGVFVFRQADAPAGAALLTIRQGEQSWQQPVELVEGVNHIALTALTDDDGFRRDGVSPGPLNIALAVDGQPQDAVTVEVSTQPVESLWAHSQWLHLGATAAGAHSMPLALPADATAIVVRDTSSAQAALMQVVDDLLALEASDIETVASRMLALSVAMPLLVDQPQQQARLRLMLQQARLRLMYLARRDGGFGWGRGDDVDAFLTTFVWYADGRAATVAGLDLPPDHWQLPVALYANGGMTLLQRAVALKMAHESGVPVAALVQRLASDIAAAADTTDSAGGSSAGRAGESGGNRDGEDPARDPTVEQAAPERTSSGQDWDRPTPSLLMAGDDDPAARLIAAGLVRELARGMSRQDGWQGDLPSGPSASDRALIETLHRSADPLVQTLLRVAAIADPCQPACSALVAEDGPDAGPEARLLALLAPQRNGMARALALAWLDLDGGRQPSASIELPAPWLRGESGHDLGSAWHWRGETLPTTLDLQLLAPLPQARWLRVDHLSAQEPAGLLDAGVTIERRLLRLVPGEQAFAFTTEPVTDGVVSSDGLYLDEITLKPQTGHPYLHYGLLQVPLPAGADVERTTWGTSIDGDAMTRSLAEPSPLAYRVEVPTLGEPVSYRHLLRFSRSGTLALPPASYQLRYAPNRISREADPAFTRIVVK